MNRPGIIYVNSTLRLRRALHQDEMLSPFHYWGHRPGPDDRVYAHRLNRVEIHLRRQLGGLDLFLLAALLCDLVRGYRKMYLVSASDLLAAVPWLVRCFPDLRIVTWAFSEEEVRRHAGRFCHCHRILTECEPARRAMERAGLGEKTEMVSLGADPGFYQRPEAAPADMEVLLTGLTCRDVGVVERAVPGADFQVATTPLAQRFMRLPRLSQVRVTEEIKGYPEVVGLLHRARAVWIPLKSGERQSTGTTNLIEALLCGTAVVIADSSQILPQILQLPGVYHYRAGDAADLLRVTRLVLSESRKPGFRKQIQEVAARTLNGRALEKALREALGI